MRTLRRSPDLSIVARTATRKPTMRWETPQAIDFRFGMEITLYIARR
jgi:coenzyme PQQ precursor peptide PqqA